MRTIYKYQLHQGATTRIKIPGEGHKILKVAEQRGFVCAWIEVDTIALSVEIDIESVGTGWELHKDVEREYIDTVLVGVLVWHYYKITPKLHPPGEE